MIYTYIKRLAFISVSFVLLVNCNTKQKHPEFIKTRAGYWLKLISFTNDSDTLVGKYAAWVNAVFTTQKDSVFYDTKNDLRDRFYLRTDSNINENLFKKAVSGLTEGDSACILIKPDVFFKQQFKSEVPYFSANDTIVKVHLKVKKIYNKKEFGMVTGKFSHSEAREIESFFGSASACQKALDPAGFYWVEKPDSSEGSFVANGDQIIIHYSGGFLNGRVIDVSPKQFQLVYGTPDQLLKGLNYVIAKLKIGQTSKIILPSQLAFGETGSSNGSVPPYTPMLYKISITDKN